MEIGLLFRLVGSRPGFLSVGVKIPILNGAGTKPEVRGVYKVDEGKEMVDSILPDLWEEDLICRCRTLINE